MKRTPLHRDGTFVLKCTDFEFSPRVGQSRTPIGFQKAIFNTLSDAETRIGNVVHSSGMNTVQGVIAVSLAWSTRQRNH